LKKPFFQKIYARAENNWAHNQTNDGQGRRPGSLEPLRVLRIVPNQALNRPTKTANNPQLHEHPVVGAH